MCSLPKFIHDTRRILSVNDAGAALFRCEAVDLIDRDMMELLSDVNYRGLARLRMVMLREQWAAPPARFSYEYLRHDGSTFWARVESEPLGEGLFETVLIYERESD